MCTLVLGFVPKYDMWIGGAENQPILEVKWMGTHKLTVKLTWKGGEG